MYLHWGHVPGEAELHRESAGDFVHDGVGVVWKRDRQRHHCPAQAQVTLHVLKTGSGGQMWGKKDKYLITDWMVASTQEPGVSVPQRSARHRGQTDDDWETADGAATAGHLSGPGLTGTQRNTCRLTETLILWESRKGRDPPVYVCCS